ncbi:MAG: hypothetical protein OXM00_11350 [Paracoccaceae bacterium]|nr:hypothetical protein [Paracoccaceae bacterium]
MGISEFHSIIPANMNGQLIQNNEDRCIFWENLETIYIENIVNGNPQTLLDRLNYGGRLVNQLPLNQNPDDWLFVVYPRSGGIMRAARSNPKILDYTVNYFLCANEVEASYLVGLLNTPALGQLIMYREFLEILFLVELVPRFDPNNNLHQELAELNLQAETTAIELIHDIMYELEDGQPLPDHRILSNLIWRNLFENGIANQLNEVVAQLLPDQIR